MKYRKHHNNKGFRTCKTGKCEDQLKKIAKRLGIKYQPVHSPDPGKEKQPQADGA